MAGPAWLPATVVALLLPSAVSVASSVLASVTVSVASIPEGR